MKAKKDEEEQTEEDDVDTDSREWAVRSAIVDLQMLRSEDT